MRRKIVAGNWKMNTIPSEGRKLVQEILNEISGKDLGNDLVVFGVPFTSIDGVAGLVGSHSNICLASQNISSYDKGAYTGEVSGAMLNASGVSHAIVGHSERREYFGEDNQVLATKVSKCLMNQIEPIYCCGEVLEQRKSETYKEVIKSQIEEGLFHLTEEEFRKVIVAYEPVWAIGTGETASPDQAQEVHAYIREIVNQKYGEDVANSLSILYGGSMKPGNAEELIGMNDIDGGLIGGASLVAKDFVAIINCL